MVRPLFIWFFQVKQKKIWQNNATQRTQCNLYWPVPLASTENQIDLTNGPSLSACNCFCLFQTEVLSLDMTNVQRWSQKVAGVIFHINTRRFSGLIPFFYHHSIQDHKVINMRSTLAISAAIATFVSTAFAADCNPSYNVPPSTECYKACNIVCITWYCFNWIVIFLTALFTIRKTVKSGFLDGLWIMLLPSSLILLLWCVTDLVLTTVALWLLLVCVWPVVLVMILNYSTRNGPLLVPGGVFTRMTSVKPLPLLPR
jgi:hypothetical protein